MSGDMYGIVIVLIVLLIVAYITMRPSEHISEQAYTLTSRGLNLMNTGNSYLGGLAVLNAAENANTVSSITPFFG